MTQRPEHPGLSDELLIAPEKPGPAPASPSGGGLWRRLALVPVTVNLRPALSSLAPALKTV